MEGFRSKPKVLPRSSPVYNPALGVNLNPPSALAAVTSVLFANAVVNALSSTSSPPTIALTSYATGMTDPSDGSDASLIVPDDVCTLSVVEAFKLDASGVFTRLAAATTKVRDTLEATFPDLSVTLNSRR